MTTSEQLQTSEKFHLANETKFARNMGHHALPHDPTSDFIANEVQTVITLDGVTTPVSNGIEQPRLAYTSQSNEFDTGELSPLLDADSIELLERTRLDLITEQANEKFGEELIGEALETYSKLKSAIDLDGYDDQYVVTSFAPDELDDHPVTTTENDDKEPRPTAKTSSFVTDYVSRLYSKDGQVEKMLSYPVPYKHGNGVMIAREDGSGNLSGIKELLEDPTVTKQEIRVLTGAVRVNHRGTPESVQSRIEANLMMPLEAFNSERARRQILSKVSR